MAKYVVVKGALVVRGKMRDNGTTVELSEKELKGIEHVVSKVDEGPKEAAPKATSNKTAPKAADKTPAPSKGAK